MTRSTSDGTAQSTSVTEHPEKLYEADPCPDCGAPSNSQIPVWEEVYEARLGRIPDFVGCTGCNTMRSVRPGDQR